MTTEAANDATESASSMSRLMTAARQRDSRMHLNEAINYRALDRHLRT
jgi:hypothetical protein